MLASPSALFQSSMSASTAGRRWRTTAPTTSSSLIMNALWKSGSKFQHIGSCPRPQRWFFHNFFMSTVPVILRQCALAALRDVKSYLKDEGGQVAVRFLSGIIFNQENHAPHGESSAGTFVTLCVRSRSLTPPTQPGTGETWSSSLVPTTTSRCVSWSALLQKPYARGGRRLIQPGSHFLSPPRFSSSSLCATTPMWSLPTSWWAADTKTAQHGPLNRSVGEQFYSPVTQTGSEGVLSWLPRLQQDRSRLGLPEENWMLQNQLPASGPRPAWPVNDQQCDQLRPDQDFIKIKTKQDKMTSVYFSLFKFASKWKSNICFL